MHKIAYKGLGLNEYYPIFDQIGRHTAGALHSHFVRFALHFMFIGFFFSCCVAYFVAGVLVVVVVMGAAV